jgi:hypothetical protein
LPEIPAAFEDEVGRQFLNHLILAAQSLALLFERYLRTRPVDDASGFRARLGQDDLLDRALARDDGIS